MTYKNKKNNYYIKLNPKCQKDTLLRCFACISKYALLPWLVALSGLSTRLQIKGSLVGYPVRAHDCVVGQVPSRGSMTGNHTLMFLSFSLSLPSPLSGNK